MTNAKPNNVFAERDALLRENERLRAELADTKRFCNMFARDWKAASDELAAARKVADAALYYFDVDTDNAEWDSQAFCTLDVAVREYRERAESNGKENAK